MVKYKVTGLLLERWFLKTLVNISFDSEFPIGHVDSKIGKPTDNLVRIAFGLQNFPKRSGLFSVVYTGQNVHSTDSFGFTPLIKDGQYIAGGLFLFRGFMFLLYLMPQGPPELLTGIQFNGEDLSHAQLNYHDETINDVVGEYLSQMYEVDW